MKTKVVQHVSRINLSYFKFQIFKFFQILKKFLVPSSCLTFRHFLNVPAQQVVTIEDVKNHTRSAIVAVIIAIAARINKQDLPHFPIY